MSRRKFEQIVSQLDGQITVMETNVKTAIELGADQSVAAMLGPRPEAKIYVNTLRKLFHKMDQGVVKTSDDMLKEIEDAWFGVLLWRDTAHTTNVNALTEVAKSLFVISDNDIIEARSRAQESLAKQRHEERQAELVRHGWNGVLGD